jgi:hypothetical protein
MEFGDAVARADRTLEEADAGVVDRRLEARNRPRIGLGSKDAGVREELQERVRVHAAIGADLENDRPFGRDQGPHLREVERSRRDDGQGRGELHGRRHGSEGRAARKNGW